MALLRAIGNADSLPVIQGSGVCLRTPAMSDYPQWAALREESRDFLRDWEPIWPRDDLTRNAFRRRLRRYGREIREDLGYAFFLYGAAGECKDVLLGGLTLSNVRRGVTQSASLGYWMGAPFANRGFMTRGVTALCDFAFDSLRLHRIEAACLPHNAASIRLLKKTGFGQEGLARRYLCIAGEWQDHLLFARLSDDPRPASA